MSTDQTQTNGPPPPPRDEKYDTIFLILLDIRRFVICLCYSLK